MRSSRLGVVFLSLLLAACGERSAGFQTSVAAPVTVAPALVRPVVAREHDQSIANAPDRGVLLDYPKSAPPQRDGALTWYPASISEAHAFASIASGEMRLAAPDGKELRLRYLRHTEQLDGNWTWVGQVVGGDPHQNAIITFGPEAVFGSIPQGAAPPLQLQTRQGRVFVVTADPSRLIRPPQGDDIRIPTLPPVAKAARAASAAPAAADAAVPHVAAAANTVDTVIGYSQGLVAYYGSVPATTTRLAYLVEYANQTIDNSQVVGRLRLVGTVQVEYADNTNNSDVLHALAGGTEPALQPLRDAREAYGADVSLMVRYGYTQQQESCGIAYLLGGGGQEITQASGDWAYGVVVSGSYTDENNWTWACGDSTLAHETGHILGSAHDRANSSGSGRYPYSYGYNTGGVCDVMAYCDDGNVEYQVYSNPRITLCDGKACGAEESEDNARSLNQTIPIIATFRATVVPYAGRAMRNDFDGDGKADVFWRNLVDGRNIVWWASDYANQSSPESVTNLSWNVVGAGDFNGDGKGDLFWRNASSGQNIVWPSGDANRKYYAATVAGQDWKVVATGDFNGDGRADIFWRNAANGQNIIWWSGEYAARTTEQSVSTAWKVVGAGDLDGDGQGDVFWRNATTGANIVWWSGKYTGFTYLPSVANLAWEVQVIGDLNGDGQADVFWRNRTTGENIIWWNGSYANLVWEPSVSTAWKIVASGDYNGDGRIDLFWRNSTTGADIIWDSGRYASRRDVTGVANLAWRVQQ